MSNQIIPLTSNPNQTFTTQLTVDGAALTLQMALAYDEMAGWWNLSVSSSAGAQLLASVPLITGWYPAANLLAQYGYLAIGSAFLLNTGGAATDYPGQGNLAQFSLLWGDTA